MRHSGLAIALCALVACSGPDVDKPGIPSAPKDAAAKAVVPPPPETPSPASNPTGAAQLPSALASTPPGTLYVCVSEAAGQQRQSVIEFPPGVVELCRKAPEMGPCRYERDACRRNGGRVFTPEGAEITRQTEAEYDKRVMRVRLKSN